MPNRGLHNIVKRHKAASSVGRVEFLVASCITRSCTLLQPLYTQGIQKKLMHEYHPYRGSEEEFMF
jgi:hypothetical protein